MTAPGPNGINSFQDIQIVTQSSYVVIATYSAQ